MEQEKLNHDSLDSGLDEIVIFENKIINSYQEIDPKDIQFLRKSENQYDDGGWENEYVYEYKTNIEGYDYNFTITVYDGSQLLYDEEEDLSHFSEYHSGRIDFSVVDGRDYVVNVGFSGINKGFEIVKDLFRFLYIQNKAQYLIVDASKNFFSFTSQEQLVSDVKKKVGDILEGRINWIDNLEETYIKNNPFDIKSISKKDKKVYISYADKDEEELDCEDFIKKFFDQKHLDDEESVHFLSHLITLLIEDGNIKKRQRMNLYKRKLSQLGFDFEIDNTNEILLAYVNDEVLKKVFNLSDEQIEVVS